ncbi:MAG: hypothetical protein IKU18_00315, partial [Bacteroidales bacterium]|nr:hypothetical protein [Bacteroidales bacterium]
MGQITIGLDFGTHQSKICVETINGPEIKYDFFKFTDGNGDEHYTLPSIIYVDKKERLSYGFKINSSPNSRKKNRFLSALNEL